MLRVVPLPARIALTVPLCRIKDEALSAPSVLTIPPLESVTAPTLAEFVFTSSTPPLIETEPVVGNALEVLR